LAAQAVRTFASFTTPKGNKFNQEYELYHQKFRREDLEDEQNFKPNVLPEKYLVSPNVTHTFVYVSTIQRLTVNLLGWQNAFAQGDSDPEYEAETGRIDIPIHAFDVIIADECHRGYTALETSTWRSVLNHFDAIKIGLTATPAPHTLALFREVIFRHSVDRAILKGYLVKQEPIKLTSNCTCTARFEKGEQVGIIDTETGEEIYDELEDESISR
jgi:type I restriction enzyme R subunit